MLAEDYQSQNRQKVVGYLDKAVVDALEQRGMAPRNLAITLTDARLRRMVRDLKKRIKKDIPTDELLKLSRHIEKPQAVLFDRVNPALLYVFDAGEKPFPSEEKRLGKFVVRVNFKDKGEPTNSVRSGGMVPTISLKDTAQYELVGGKL